MAAAHLFAATAYAQQPAAQVPQKQVPSDSDSAHFDQYLAPLLAIRCLSCHSGPEPKGELDLSTSAAAMRGGQSGVAIVPKELNHSRLWEYVDTDLMPPKKPLSPEEKSLIKNWIANGAAWGTSTIDPYRYSTDTRAGLDWWSLQPIVKTESDQVPGLAANDARNLKNSIADKSKNDHENVHKHAHKIDMLVRQQLSKVGLAPSPPADKRTLIRRVTFDLLGLPPTVEEVDAFLSDTSEHAYEKLVDRLLKSPHYGERWARHWLDVVRFGESNGFEYDEPRENFWSYRNWVIDAFNSDLPYDEFVRQQIAGDALAPDDLSSAAATGFLVAGPHNTTLPSNTKMRMAMAQDEMEDLVGIVGQAFLGLTINCARCHDHKFDPITQKEYYQLTSALAGVTHGQRTIRVPLGPQERARVEKIDQRLRTIAADLELIRQPIRKRWLSQRNSERRPIVPPIALATWEFDGNLEDTRGNLNLKASGGAKIDRGALVLDGKRAMAFSDVLPQEIGEKTLEVWVQLATLDQRGGGLLTIEKADGSIFDSIVYAEQEPKKWMAGSNFFSRTKPFQNSSEEIEADQKVVHLAFVYQADGTIVAYRNGQPYGQAYDSGDLQRFDPAKARIVFGLRHSPVGGNRMLTGRIERAQFYARALTRDEVELSAAYSEQGNLPREMLIQQLQPEQRQSYIALEKEVVELNAEKQTLIDSEQRTLYTCVSTPPAKTHVLLRGDVGSPTEEVLPTGLRALASVPSQWHMSASASDRERRLQLASWITHRDNPLFPRVIVNRLWQYHFGHGLVETSSDFGFNGGLPSHPELLDALAEQLIANDYQLKALQRALVTSETYRQSSDSNAAAVKIDAGNRWLWRMSPTRLDAETLRDAMLLMTNRLDKQVGGRGYRDMRHFFYKGSNFYESIVETGSEARRRTIYRFIPRGGNNAFLTTFDCPDPSATTPRRAVTTTPLQALALLNNPFTFEMSDALAERIKTQVGENQPQQIELAYLIVFNRPANDDEIQRCQAFVQQHDLPALCRILLNSNEFLYVR